MWSTAGKGTSKGGLEALLPGPAACTGSPGSPDLAQGPHSASRLGQPLQLPTTDDER